jgi:hypothetical protein
MWCVSLTGLTKATDGSSEQVHLEEEEEEEEEEEALKKAASRRSCIDKEVDLEIWTWYKDQQTKGSKPSWHEVVCALYH